MNAAASLVYALVVLGLLACLAQWAGRLPVFALRVVSVEGEIERSNPAQLRAGASAGLQGNFFTLDLRAAREAFEALPWVRQAVLHRVFPNRLEVRLLEHKAAAIWAGDDDRDDRLVSTLGEVFEANVGDVEDEGLPTFDGPEGSAARMLAMHARLAPLFQGLGGVDVLHLSRRGSWSVELGGGRGGAAEGARIELGRGSQEEVAGRGERFVRTLGQVTAQYGRALKYADLRHADGYAVRLAGISTTPAQPGKNR